MNHAILLSGLYEKLGRVGDKQICYQGRMKRQDGLRDKQILLSGLYEETGRVGDKPKLLSGLYEETGLVADKQILL